ncbi:MAG: sporulation-specific protein 15 [Selenomonadaceae bacterium]|nr:sporulation-specific protein 15 [Selenomonadaceae bacterium]
MENKLDTMRALARLKKHIGELHDLRNTINESLAKVRANNLAQALTQKKHLKELKERYAVLEQEITILPPLDAAEVLEPEFDYVTTIENILTTTAELKRGAKIGAENAEAMKEGLVVFYDGLRREMGR